MTANRYLRKNTVLLYRREDVIGRYLVGDGFNLSEGVGTFDRIIVTAAMPELPPSLLSRLGQDGLLIAPVGPPAGAQTLVRLVRSGGGDTTTTLLDVRFVPALPGIAREL
jgi:protein-L-isoaspartate(D-aspartate) O-methyltransferase